MSSDFWGDSYRSRRETPPKTYDTAQVCINGHVVNSSYNRYPAFNEQFCATCGAETITTCQHCNSPIKGDYGVTTAHYERRAYCDSCGKPYPWTATSIEAARELIQFSEQLNQTEKDDFKLVIPDLITDTPKTKVALAKFSAYAKKMGKEAASGIRDIIVDIASEAVKKSIWNG